MALGYPTTSGSYESQQFGPAVPFTPGYFDQPAMYALGFTVAWWNPYKGWQWYGHYHNGLDVAGPKGLALRALESGVVTHKGLGMIPGTDTPNGGGLVVEVRIRPGTFYTFNHCSGFPVSLSVGDTVSKGQVIAYIGSTGVATGDHCHVSLDIDERGMDGVTRRLAWNPKMFMLGGPYAGDPRIQPIGLPDTSLPFTEAVEMAIMAKVYTPEDVGRLFGVHKGVQLRKGPGENYPKHFLTTGPIKYVLTGIATDADGRKWYEATSTKDRTGRFYVPPEH